MDNYFLKRFATVLALLFSGALIAQQSTISGIVTDDTGPLPGVNIVEKGTSNGATTDFDGNYSITVSSDAVLVFSYIGYQTQEVPLSGQTELNITLVV